MFSGDPTNDGLGDEVLARLNEDPELAALAKNVGFLQSNGQVQIPDTYLKGGVSSSMRSPKPSRSNSAMDIDTQDDDTFPGSPSRAFTTRLASTVATAPPPAPVEAPPQPERRKRGRPRTKKKNDDEDGTYEPEVQDEDELALDSGRRKRRKKGEDDEDGGLLTKSAELTRSGSIPNLTPPSPMSSVAPLASTGPQPIAAVVSAANKGLRHFSKIVCDKVQSKQSTTYNEVADELVEDFAEMGEAEPDVDQKNIRRRVYDALNVLMAMNIISKDKKEIRWIGLPPTNAKEELVGLQVDHVARQRRVDAKREHLAELESQIQLYQKLVRRNSSALYQQTSEKVALPFIIIHTSKDTAINLDMTPNRTEYLFDFSMPFTLYDDSEILKRMETSGALDADNGSSLPLPGASVPERPSTQRKAASAAATTATTSTAMVSLPRPQSLASVPQAQEKSTDSNFLSSVRQKAQHLLSLQNEIVAHLPGSPSPTGQ